MPRTIYSAFYVSTRTKKKLIDLAAGESLSPAVIGFEKKKGGGQYEIVLLFFFEFRPLCKIGQRFKLCSTQ